MSQPQIYGSKLRLLSILGTLTAVTYIGGVVGLWWFTELPPECLGNGPWQKPTFFELAACSPSLVRGSGVEIFLFLWLWSLPALVVGFIIYAKLKKRRDRTVL